MNVLDRVIGWISPSRGLQRAQQRALTNYVRAYEGGGRGRRFEGWKILRGASANREIQLTLPVMRDRHRALVQNNPWILRAKTAVVTHTISFGITTQLRAPAPVREAWKTWSGTTACDFDGVCNYAGLQALVMGAIVESGECLVRKRWRRPTAKLPIPLQLQVLEPDYLDHTLTIPLPNNGRIIQGVEFDGEDRRIAYWLFTTHPGDVLSSGGRSERVPADEVLHIYRRDRPGQVRGVPWGHAIILTARDADEFEDAVLMHEKFAAAPSAFLHDLSAEYERQFDAGKEQASRIEPGGIEMVPPGLDVKMSTPPTPRDISPMLRSYLMRIAAAYGVSYAALTGDLTRVNFSSGRMGHIDMGRNIDSWQWQMLEPQLLTPVVEWFGQGCRLAGINGQIKSAEHGMPSRGLVDPVKEYEAMATAVRNGFKSLPAALRELGEQPDEVLAEIAASNELLDKLKLILDSDPRKKASAGQSAARSSNRARNKRKTKTRAAA